MTHPLRCGPRPGLLAVIVCLTSTSHLTAQTIQGRVLDAETEQPVVTAEVTLLGEGDEALRTVLSDSAGKFVLTAPRSGRYMLRAGRIGYQEVTSPPVDLLPEEVLSVELHIGVQAVALAPLTVTSDRQALVIDPWLARWGYYERRELYAEKMGFATFLDYEDIERKIAFRIADVLRGVPGIRVRSAGGRNVEIVTRRGCRPTFYINGSRVHLRHAETIDHFVDATSLVAVEVYPGMVHAGRFPGSCGGAVVLWIGLPPR